MKIRALLVLRKFVLLSYCLPVAVYAQSSAVIANPADTLTSELADFQLDKAQADLERMPRGPERDYLAGVLANRRGRASESIRLLNNALPNLRRKGDGRETIALQTLADDYTKIFDYAAAAKAYDELAVLSPKQGDGDDAKVLHLLVGAKPMAISWRGPTRLKMTRNDIGLLCTDLAVNGVKGEWILDTGANYSILSASFARKLGVRPLPGFAQTGSGITGLENRLEVAIIPTMQIGGGTLQNVAVQIFDDKNLNIQFGKRSYQINAILGYPVFQAMRAVTFTHDGEFESGTAAYLGSTAVPMYMKRLTPVADFKTNGVDVPFTLDTGGLNTELSVRYYNRLKKSGLGWKQAEEEFSGAGGTVRRRIFMQPVLRIGIGDRTAVLKDVSISPQKMNSGVDELYGNVGLDVFEQFESFTFDFADMTFRVGRPIPKTDQPLK